MNEKILPRASDFSNPPKPAALRAAQTYTILGLILWLIASLIGGWNGLFSQPDAPPTFVGLFIIVPIIVMTTAYNAGANFRAFVHSINLRLITLAHVWRFIGFGFILAHLIDKLPAAFAYPEGIGDIIAAALAIPVASALGRHKPIKHYFVAWNIFGLVDLISAVTVGILYSQGTFGVLRTGVSTALMVTFPINLIPTFFVPLFMLLHILALKRRHEVRNLL